MKIITKQEFLDFQAKQQKLIDEYIKHCDTCNCDVTKKQWSRHMKSKTHRIKTENYTLLLKSL
jgi:hypothetical protein